MTISVTEPYIDWLRGHYNSVISKCEQLGFSDELLNEIDTVFNNARYGHFDFDHLVEVISYGLRTINTG